MGARRSRVRIIACGALARELTEVLRDAALGDVRVECLPAALHDRPERIPDLVRARVRSAKAAGEHVLVGYADCGTGGRLDAVCAEEGVERLPGAHCYELFAGPEVFAALHEREPGTFYVTDYLVRNFDRLVVAGLGLDRHPELQAVYFGNYRRLVHLAQHEDDDLDRRARAAAKRLGLVHERRATGVDGLRRSLHAVGAPR
ncbi:DUF1638 domain-containing protein [Egicoccus sp. AB-alg2]|uniref:DUF1638 domain-containing protein n=1 Tax=Egicoccus sp. AB-alg2 TaxID=3242693 RepID=UPI00359E8753